MNTIVFHIRQRHPSARRSAWKLAVPTLCGQAATRHDIKFDWAALPLNDAPAGNYVPCPHCLALRAQQRAAQRKGRP
jgi:hypothetical protein